MSNFNMNSHWAHLRCLSFGLKLPIWQHGGEATAWMLLSKQWRWFWTSGGTQPHHPACPVDIDKSFSHDLKWKLNVCPKKKATKKTPHIGGSMSCSYWRNSTCIRQKWCTFTPLWLNPSSLIYPIEISTSLQHSIYVLYNIFLFFWNKLVLTVTTITLKPQKH